MALAVLRRKRLYTGTLGAGANTVIFTAGTAPLDGSAKNTFRFTICNKTASPVNAYVGIDSSGLLGLILNAYPIPGNDTYIHDLSIDLMGGEKLQAWASAGTSLDISLTGVEASDT